MFFPRLVPILVFAYGADFPYIFGPIYVGLCFPLNGRPLRIVFPMYGLAKLRLPFVFHI